MPVKFVVAYRLGMTTNAHAYCRLQVQRQEGLPWQPLGNFTVQRQGEFETLRAACPGITFVDVGADEAAARDVHEEDVT